MPTLRSVLETRLDFQLQGLESNLEEGRIWSYNPGTGVGTNFCCGVCWRSPGTGTAVIEIWGAGGSGAKMCCCGFGLPGNPGAYSSKTVSVTVGCCIRGNVGLSCGNSDDLCYRGRSESTGICWQGNGTTGCMCAEGGQGGFSYCSTTPSAYCCFTANGFCSTRCAGDNCGIVCNYRGPGCAIHQAQAYGGDCNIAGGFSCVSFFGCLPSCPCAFWYHMRTPPKQYADCGAWITYTNDTDNGAYNWSGGSVYGYIHTLGLASRNPTHGGHYTACWTGNRYCGCYNMNGCLTFVPPAHGGPPPHPCPDVRDHAYRGGHGIIRIKYTGTGILGLN